MSRLKKIILAALLIAVGVVLGRFLSIKTPILSISFSFIPIMLSGILLGPWWTMIIGGLIDLIGALLFPFGAYFVGYTISSMLAGLIYGLLLFRKKKMSKKKFLVRLIIAVLLVIVICNSVLNTLWIYITTKKAVAVLLPTRLLKQLIMLPIQVVVIFLIDLGLDKMGIYNKFLYSDEGQENEQTISDDKETSTNQETSLNIEEHTEKKIEEENTQNKED